MRTSCRRRSLRVSRQGKALLPASLLLLLLVAAQVAPAAASAGPKAAAPQAGPAASVTLTESVGLRQFDYRGYQVESFSNSTTVLYAATSDAPVSTALMTAAQYGEWQANLSDPISNSLAHQNGTQVQNSVSVGPGSYYLVFYAYYSRALVQFGYRADPSTPFSYGPLSTPLGMGLASFGITNKSGTASAYQVRTPEIVGVANVSSVQVDTPNAQSYGVSVTGFSLQLNAMLVVNDGTGAAKVYWVQNVPELLTGPSTAAFGDQIWNVTSPSAVLTNQTITSTNFRDGGYVYTTGRSRFSSGQTLYAYTTGNATYALPLDFGLLMSETVVPGTGVEVRLGYSLISNGTAGASPTVWFDSVTIHDPSVASAYFLVSGSKTPPIGLYYDAELVFAGQGNLEPAFFTQLDASLGLFYRNGTALTSFPSYYGFSGDTGEAADNLVETYSNGIVSLAPGSTPSYPYLGGASLTLPQGSFGAAGSTTGLTTSSGSAPTGGQAPGPGLEAAAVSAAAVVAAAVIIFVITRLGPSGERETAQTEPSPANWNVPPYA